MGLLDLFKKKAVNNNEIGLNDLPPLEDSSIQTQAVSPQPDEFIPAPNLNTSSSVPETSLDPSPIETDVPLDIPEKLPEGKPLAPIIPEKKPFDVLPDFSEDDFSEPLPPADLADVESGLESSYLESNSLKDVDSSKHSELFNQVIQSEKADVSLNEDVPVSFANSQGGVFVSRSSYIFLLKALKESSSNLKSLNTKQKHLVDFDNSTKKLLTIQAEESEKLHKEILEVIPFLSTK